MGETVPQNSFNNGSMYSKGFPMLQKWTFKSEKVDIENEKADIQERKVDIENEKADIQERKVDIENEKADIQETKVDIERKLYEKGKEFSGKTIVHIYRFFIKFGYDEAFGRSAVMEFLELKSSSASKLLSNMLQTDIIEPVSGHGKGKYRFKI